MGNFVDIEPYTQDFIRENQMAQGRCKKCATSKTTRNNGA
jgi:hypothetical protein